MTKMLVESYECDEIVDETMEMEEEAVRVINALGLDGQKDLLHLNEAAEARPVRDPFRKMTKEEFFVFKVLCPSNPKLAEYKDGPIPTRVLQIAERATTLETFKELRVWCPENADFKDPVLVGTKMPNSYTTEYYILARWGEVLLDMPTLIKMAMEKWISKQRTAYNEIARKAKAGLEALDSATADYAASHISPPSFYEF